MAWSAGQAREMRRRHHLGEFARDAAPHKSKMPKTARIRPLLKTRGGTALEDGRRRSGIMVRHRRGRAFARRGGARGNRGMGGLLKHGFIPLGSGIMGLALSAAAGYAAATYVNPRLPQIVPMQSQAVAFAAGGLPGVVASMLATGISTPSNAQNVPVAGI